MRRWIRWFFLAWASFATLWLANSVRTRGVNDDLLESGATVTVNDGAETLGFTPVTPTELPGLVFIAGSGISAHAYAPMLRPIAESGHVVAVVKLPWRFAPMDSHKEGAISRAARAMSAHADVHRWVVAGHSLGGALAARVVQDAQLPIAGLVLIGTTHPKEQDLSSLAMPVTKVYATDDGVAPAERVLANRGLLPAQTTWIAIEGGNHSQFGHYGHQLFDGKATITREAQQEITRSALLAALAQADSP